MRAACGRARSDPRWRRTQRARSCADASRRARSGKVDQSAGSMLSSDVADKGFVLLCCGRPESDCSVKTVDEARRRLRARTHARLDSRAFSFSARAGGAAVAADAQRRAVGVSRGFAAEPFCVGPLITKSLGGPRSIVRVRWVQRRAACGGGRACHQAAHLALAVVVGGGGCARSHQEGTRCDARGVAVAVPSRPARAVAHGRRAAEAPAAHCAALARCVLSPGQYQHLKSENGAARHALRARGASDERRAAQQLRNAPRQPAATRALCPPRPPPTPQRRAAPAPPRAPPARAWARWTAR